MPNQHPVLMCVRRVSDYTGRIEVGVSRTMRHRRTAGPEQRLKVIVSARSLPCNAHVEQGATSLGAYDAERTCAAPRLALRRRDGSWKDSSLHDLSYDPSHLMKVLMPPDTNTAPISTLTAAVIAVVRRTRRCAAPLVALISLYPVLWTWVTGAEAPREHPLSVGRTSPPLLVGDSTSTDLRISSGYEP